MAFKLNIGHKGKSWKLEVQDESLIGKSVGDIIKGEEVKQELQGYELQVTGGSDNAGFPLFEEVEGLGLKRLLLKKGKGMRDTRPGVRIRKTVRGKTISSTTSQINLKVTKAGAKSLEEIFPDQNKAPEPAKPAETAPAA